MKGRATSREPGREKVGEGILKAPSKERKREDRGKQLRSEKKFIIHRKERKKKSPNPKGTTVLENCLGGTSPPYKTGRESRGKRERGNFTEREIGGKSKKRNSLHVFKESFIEGVRRPLWEGRDIEGYEWGKCSHNSGDELKKKERLDEWTSLVAKRSGKEGTQYLGGSQ